MREIDVTRFLGLVYVMLMTQTRHERVFTAIGKGGASLAVSKCVKMFIVRVCTALLHLLTICGHLLLVVPHA